MDGGQPFKANKLISQIWLQHRTRRPERCCSGLSNINPMNATTPGRLVVGDASKVVKLETASLETRTAAAFMVNYIDPLQGNANNINELPAATPTRCW